jgi:hypothetical protein
MNEAPEYAAIVRPEGSDLSDWIFTLGNPPHREPTEAEKNIARAWVDRHRWVDPLDAVVEYEHALSLLVFANARPPLDPIECSRLPMCLRCRHPHDWHRLDDTLNLDPTDPATPFRCLGYDPSADGPLSTCDCPDVVTVRG